MFPLLFQLLEAALGSWPFLPSLDAARAQGRVLTWHHSDLASAPTSFPEFLFLTPSSTFRLSDYIRLNQVTDDDIPVLMSADQQP